MTAPLTNILPDPVGLLPVNPDDQSEADWANLYCRGAVVRLIVDGVVLTPCVESDGHSRIPAVLVMVDADCPDAGQVRVWRVSEIVESPLDRKDRDRLCRAALGSRPPKAVRELLRSLEPVPPGDPAAAPESAAAERVSADTQAETPTRETAGTGPSAPDDGADAKDDERADDDLPFGDLPVETIPAGVLDFVTDESLCEIRRAAADGQFGSHGYEVIDGAFRRREKRAQDEAMIPGASDAARLRRTMFHYCGLYAEARDEGDADRAANPGCR